MKHRQDNNAASICAEINAVREAIGYDSPDIFSDNSELEGMAGSQRYATLDLGDEFNTEASAFTFVPCACFDKLCTGSTMK
jgi:hypothetical protein